MFFVCCAPDTNVAGLDNYVTLKLNLRTVGVDRYYVPENRLITVCGLMGPQWYTYCGISEYLGALVHLHF